MNAMVGVFRKDARRLAMPVALLVLATAGGTAWFGGSVVEADTAWSDWVGVMHWWTQLLALGQLLFVLLLTATLVQEDAPAAPDAFWATRPIGRGELLLAKAAGALAWLALAPALGQVPVWWALGFDAGAVGHAVVHSALRSAVAVGFGLMAGALTRTLPQFLLTALGLGLAMGFVGGAATTMERSWTENAVRRERMETVQVLLMLFPLAVAVHRFHARRSGGSWGVAAGGLAAIVAAGWFWPWRADEPPAADDGAVEKPVLLAMVGREGAAIPGETERVGHGPVLRVSTGQPTAERVVVVSGGRGELRRADGARARVILIGESRFPDALWRAAAGAGDRPGEATWTLAVRRRQQEPAVFRTGPMEWSGKVTLAAYRRAEVTEVALRDGGAAADGPNQWQIRRYEPPRAEARALLEIEERGPWRGGAEVGHVRLPEWRRTIEAWLWRRGGDGAVTVLAVEEVGSVVLGGVVRSVRRLTLPDGVTEAELAGSALVKVRFERDGEAAHPVTAAVVAKPEDKS